MNNHNAREKSNTGSVFIPDFALPSQLVPARRWSAEMRLMYAVLEEAISTYRQYRYDPNRHAQNMARSAHDWITDTNSRWPFSFINICHALGIDPDYIRRGLQRIRERKLRIDKYQNSVGQALKSRVIMYRNAA